MSDRCTSYCGVACVNGYCLNIDGFAVGTYCDFCLFYNGCLDCAFVGTDYCPKLVDESGDLL